MTHAGKSITVYRRQENRDDDNNMKDGMRQIICTLLTTQLMAAEVYAHFLRVSSRSEHELWGNMLNHELEHIEELRGLLRSDSEVAIDLPEINLVRLREITNQIIDSGSEQFILRLEGALRLESAELDYGLEGMAVRRIHRQVGLQNDIPAIRSHIKLILDTAKRYSGARNIDLLIRRLQELTEASTTDTQHYERPGPLDQ